MSGYTYVGKLNNSFICDKRLKDYDIRVYLVLLKWKNSKEQRSVRNLAEEIGLSSKSFGRSIKRLEALKYIKIERNTNWDTNKYRLLNKAHGTESPVEENESPPEGTEVPLNEGTEVPPLNKKGNIKKENKQKKKTPPDSVCEEIISYLNEKAGRNFEIDNEDHHHYIRLRWKKYPAVDKFKFVIDVCVLKWKDNDKMRDYLQPSTLFNGKFGEKLGWTLPKQQDHRTPAEIVQAMEDEAKRLQHG